MIVSNPNLAKEKLRESGVIVKTTDVIGIVLDDTPGAMAKVISLLSKSGVIVEYSYAFLASKNNGALIVMRTDDKIKTEKLLLDAGIGLVDPAEVYRV